MPDFKPTAQELLEPVVRIARAAGEAIMQVYGTDFGVRGKADASPVTEADVRAEKLILEGLREATADHRC